MSQIDSKSPPVIAIQDVTQVTGPGRRQLGAADWSQSIDEEREKKDNSRQRQPDASGLNRPTLTGENHSTSTQWPCRRVGDEFRHRKWLKQTDLIGKSKPMVYFESKQSFPNGSATTERPAIHTGVCWGRKK
jgi:hypothetical protein